MPKSTDNIIWQCVGNLTMSNCVISCQHIVFVSLAVSLIFQVIKWQLSDILSLLHISTADVAPSNGTRLLICSSLNNIYLGIALFVRRERESAKQSLCKRTIVRHFAVATDDTHCQQQSKTAACVKINVD